MGWYCARLRVASASIDGITGDLMYGKTYSTRDNWILDDMIDLYRIDIVGDFRMPNETTMAGLWLGPVTRY